MPLIDPVTMSSPAGKAEAPSSQKPADGDAPTKPIVILGSPQAQAARHIQPVVLISLFCLQFGTLVRDPVAAMWTAVPVVLGVQGAYAIVCLPPAGSQGVKAPKKPRPGEKKKQAADAGGPNIVLVSRP
ncbi:hypothetical protein BX600DRAFT_458363 [Xylariales sp. PMI_506]|nr:hypothetical protein BX600DRAFT_458363 [Xylariales sp. PMI_506]